MPLSREPRTITVRRSGGRKLSESLRPADDPVRAGVIRATRAWKEYVSNREYDRDAIYSYLTTVFEVIQEWRKERKANRYSLQALQRAKFPIRMKADPYARLIYCTSREDDPKSRSKWAKVMRWVEKYNKRGRSFDKFVKRHGGLNECAEMARFDLEPKAY